MATSHAGCQFCPVHCQGTLRWGCSRLVHMQVTLLGAKHQAASARLAWPSHQASAMHRSQTSGKQMQGRRTL